MIHLTPNGVYADTHKELLAFYDRLHTGDPVVLGHLMLSEMRRKLLEEDPIEELVEEALVW